MWTHRVFSRSTGLPSIDLYGFTVMSEKQSRDQSPELTMAADH